MIKKLAILALAALTGVAQAQLVTNLFPNGDFAADLTDWQVGSGGGSFVFTNFPTGGNPDGYGVIDNSGGGGWGIFVGGDAASLPLSAYGLIPGGTNTFLVDMKVFTSAPQTNIGGFKVDFFNYLNAPVNALVTSSTGDINLGDARMIVPGGSSVTNWATYNFVIPIPAGMQSFKVVPLWGANSLVGFDNIGVVALASSPLSVAITTPADASTVGTNFLIVANASVLPGSVTNVNFFLGASLLGSDDAAPFSLSVSNAALGAAALTAVAMDDNGGMATSSIVNVTVTGAAPPTNTFLVDPAAGWSSYMAVRERPDNLNGFVFDVPGWGIGALTAGFSGSGPSSKLSLNPGYAPGDTNSFWFDYTVDPLASNGTNLSGAVGNKEMEGIYFVEIPAGTVNGNVVKFIGTCITNTLDIRLNPASTNGIGFGWTNYAFVKELAVDNSVAAESLVIVTSGQPFSVTHLTAADPTRRVQYGFVTRGPNVWETDINSHGVVEIQSLDVTSTNVVVNSSSSWVGFMNVSETPANGSGYVFGSPWGTADLVAVFNSAGLVLSPNTIGDPDPFWYVGGGGPGAIGNKIMDASMYVQIGSLPNRKLVFSGNVLSNSLVSASNTNAAGNGWTSVAFIKDFAPDFSSFNSVTVPLTPGAFSISLNTVNDPARVVQYGFETVGPNVWVTDVAPFGNIVIGNAATQPTSITPTLSGGSINLSFPTQVGKVYTVQYKNLLTDPSWSTLTTTNGTAATVVIGDPAGNGQRYYRLSIQ